jgi:hypothetical protein
MPWHVVCTDPTSNCHQEDKAMKRFMLAVGLAGVLGTLASGCVVRERRVAVGPGRCPGGYWIEGHYSPRGRWHPGHWVCPGVVDRIEIE